MARRDLTGAVDFAYLVAYAGADAGVVDEVVGLFQQQAEMWLRLLDPAADAGGWKDAAHTLKGSALGIGAKALAEACAAAELAVDADMIERTLRLARVRDALQAVLGDIAAYRHEQALRGLKSPPR